jgi:hypothetical protein
MSAPTRKLACATGALFVAAFTQSIGLAATPGSPAIQHVVPLEEMLAGNKALSEEFKQRIRANVAAIRRGDPVVQAGSVPGLEKRIELMRPLLKPIEELMAGGLTRSPSDLSATSLHEIGATVTGAKVLNGWTGVGRVFKHPQLGPVILSEVDLSAGNSATRTMPMEAVNASIRMQPGVLSVLSDPDTGLSMTRLVWVDGAGVSYEMLTQRTDTSAKEALLQIAGSIKP